MVAPGVKREVVAHVVSEHGVSQRRACKALAVDRSSVRYRSMPVCPPLREMKAPLVPRLLNPRRLA